MKRSPGEGGVLDRIRPGFAEVVAAPRVEGVEKIRAGEIEFLECHHREWLIR